MRAKASAYGAGLPPAQRARLLALIDAVPEGATVQHDAVQNIIEFYGTIVRPPEAPAVAADYKFRLGIPVEDVLAELRQLADWSEL